MSKHSDNSFNVLERLTDLRQLYGDMSIYELAKHSGIARGTIQNWYDKNNYPPIDKLEAICHVFGITLADFFYEEDHPGINDEGVTIEDKLLLSQWYKLSPDNKSLVKNTVNALLKGNVQE